MYSVNVFSRTSTSDEADVVVEEEEAEVKKQVLRDLRKLFELTDSKTSNLSLSLLLSTLFLQNASLGEANAWIEAHSRSTVCEQFKRVCGRE